MAAVRPRPAPPSASAVPVTIQLPGPVAAMLERERPRCGCYPALGDYMHDLVLKAAGLDPTAYPRAAAILAPRRPKRP